MVTKELAIGYFDIPEPEPEPLEPPLSGWEQAQLDTALNVEYLICLQEGKV